MPCIVLRCKFERLKIKINNLSIFNKMNEDIFVLKLIEEITKMFHNSKYSVIKDVYCFQPIIEGEEYSTRCMTNNTLLVIKDCEKSFVYFNDTNRKILDNFAKQIRQNAKA